MSSKEGFNVYVYFHFFGCSVYVSPIVRISLNQGYNKRWDLRGRIFFINRFSRSPCNSGYCVFMCVLDPNL